VTVSFGKLSTAGREGRKIAAKIKTLSCRDRFDSGSRLIHINVRRIQFGSKVGVELRLVNWAMTPKRSSDLKWTDLKVRPPCRFVAITM
jgi:hypothetical protein